MIVDQVLWDKTTGYQEVCGMCSKQQMKISVSPSIGRTEEHT
jgi:hypothetical protein